MIDKQFDKETFKKSVKDMTAKGSGISEPFVRYIR